MNIFFFLFITTLILCSIFLYSFSPIIKLLNKNYASKTLNLAGNFNKKRIQKNIILIIFFLLFSLICVVIYFFNGSFNALSYKESNFKAISSLTKEDFIIITEKLKNELKDKPENIKGWQMLSNSYKVLGQLDDAIYALKKAINLEPDNAEINTDYAELLLVKNNGKYNLVIIDLLESSYKKDSNNNKTLILLANYEFSEKNYNNAIEYWSQALISISENDVELKEAIKSNILEAKKRKSGVLDSLNISGTVSLNKNLINKIPKNTPVFIFAKINDKAPPISAIKVMAEDLPYKYELIDIVRMTENIELKQNTKIIVRARIPMDNSLKMSKGDLYGSSSSYVFPGQKNVDFEINKKY